MDSIHHLHPSSSSNQLHKVEPKNYGWQYLNFTMMKLVAGASYQEDTKGREMALVPLSGQFKVEIAAETFSLIRENVFDEMPDVLYIPPNHKITIRATTDCELTLGGAPAEGKYPLRLFRPKEMKREVRGGGPACRQVNHILAHPMPAERLILFEVYVPGGAWSGWPPHCHDGFDGSPYLEETYFYRFRPEAAGFAFHRNYRVDEDFNEVFSVKHDDLVLVTRGFHPTVTSPGSAMFFLNYLAGDLLDDERATPPLEDKDWSYMRKDHKWYANRFSLPRF